MNESSTLAKYIAKTDYDDLPPQVVAVTKKSILDALGVTLAAGTLGDGCKQFVHLAITQGGNGESTIIGFDAKVSATMAAFANGSMANALSFEDSYDSAPAHPNASTIPAALAVAELIGNVSGRKLITAIALGCDIVCRLGLALTVNLVEYGWYPPPILGAFGATTAAGKLLNLTQDQILDAFSLTLCQATCSAELIASPHSLIGSVRDAFSAKAGVLSALLAQDGITGFAQPIEGKAGLYSSYARGNYDPQKLTNDLGRVFEGAHVSFKPWPSCRGTHSYIEAALEIQREHNLTPVDVREIKVVVNAVNKMLLCEPVEIKQQPQTAIDARLSIPFVIATALVRGGVRLDDFSASALADRTVLELARKVMHELDPRLGFNEMTQGSVEIKTTRNETYSKRVDYPYGHPRNPMREDKLIAKFMDCAQHAHKKYRVRELERVVELVQGLDRIENVRELTQYL